MCREGCHMNTSPKTAEIDLLDIQNIIEITESLDSGEAVAETARLLDNPGDIDQATYALLAVARLHAQICHLIDTVKSVFEQKQ